MTLVLDGAGHVVRQRLTSRGACCRFGPLPVLARKGPRGAVAWRPRQTPPDATTVYESTAIEAAGKREGQPY